MTWFSIAAWKERRRALRDLGRLQYLDHQVLILDEGNFVNRAKMAMEAGDQTAALQFWQEALMRYPAFAKASHDALPLLIGLERFDEAEALMLEGLRLRPRDQFCAEGYALVAEKRGDIEVAIERWARVRKKFPGSAWAFIHGTNCLRQAGRLKAADKLNAASIRRFPDDQRVWMDRARIAEERGEWEEAFRRWDAVADRFNRHVVAEQGAARVLEKLGRITEAEARLKVAQQRSPLVPGLAVARAELAELRGDKTEAAACWAEMVRRFPLLPKGYREGFRVLRDLGRDAEAEALMAAAVERFPAEAWPAIEHAALASARHDWGEAAERWTKVRERWPGRSEGYQRGAEALAALGREAEAETVRTELRTRRLRSPQEQAS